MSDYNSNYKRFNTAIGFILIFGILAIIAITSINNFTGFFKNDDYTVQAYFTNIGELKVGAPVSIGGIKVGEVTQIILQENTKIKVVSTQKLTSPLPVDSVMSIESTTVSGDTFVSITRGKSFHTIEPVTNSTEIATLKGNNFFNISELGTFFGNLGESITKIIDSGSLIFGDKSTLRKELETLDQEKVKLTEEYIALRDDIEKSTPLFMDLDEKINRCVRKADQIRTTIDGALSAKTISQLRKNIEEINTARAEIKLVLTNNRKKRNNISSNLVKIRNWSNNFTFSENSVISVLISDKCSGLPATLSLIGESIQKVNDFSLMKKLGFYFRAKDLFTNFLDSLPNTYRYSPALLYNSWAKSEYSKRTKQFLSTPDGCSRAK